MKIIPPNFFPNMPAEVREMWLDSVAAGYGWPFDSLDDPTEDTPWFHVFCKFPLKVWAAVEWELREIDITKNPLRPSSHLAIMSIQQQHKGLSTIVAGVVDTEKRFRACADFIQANGSIPKPIVGIFRPDGFDIVDGNHRVAALQHLKMLPTYRIPCWIALPPKIQEANKQRLATATSPFVGNGPS
jgi:hypothetical protein